MIGQPLPPGQLAVTHAPDCGNAPKKKLLLDIHIALAEGDLSPLLDQVADNVVWERVGIAALHGKEQLAQALEAMRQKPATSLLMDNIITHGNTASANGVLSFGEEQFHFCCVYVFGGFSKQAKIKAITSYEIVD